MRPTYGQIGRLLALQAEAGRTSTIPDTEEEAEKMISEIETLNRYRDDWRWRLQMQAAAPRRMVRA